MHTLAQSKHARATIRLSEHLWTIHSSKPFACPALQKTRLQELGPRFTLKLKWLQVTLTRFLSRTYAVLTQQVKANMSLLTHIFPDTVWTTSLNLYIRIYTPHPSPRTPGWNIWHKDRGIRVGPETKQNKNQICPLNDIATNTEYVDGTVLLLNCYCGGIYIERAYTFQTLKKS